MFVMFAIALRTFALRILILHDCMFRERPAIIFFCIVCLAPGVYIASLKRGLHTRNVEYITYLLVSIHLTS